MPSTQPDLVRYDPSEDSREGPVLERALALGLGSLVLFNVTIAGAVLLDFIGIISAILLSMITLLLCGAIIANGIRNMMPGSVVIEID